jgi:hypothetical protein
VQSGELLNSFSYNNFVGSHVNDAIVGSLVYSYNLGPVPYEYVKFEILTSHLFMLYRETLISYISLMRNMEFHEPWYAYETRMEKLGELIFSFF